MKKIWLVEGKLPGMHFFLRRWNNQLHVHLKKNICFRKNKYIIKYLS